MRNLLRHTADSLGPTRCLAITSGLAILLSGCQSMETGGLATSAAPPEISGPAAGAIAGDMVSRLAEQIGRGRQPLRSNRMVLPSARHLKQR